jgi:sterol desaturase/sphingolipid hydroxylase (fatty acid hydroxylase superfamily)
MPLNPDDLEIAGFFLLVVLFDVSERLRPARDVNRLADLRIDLLSFTLAVAINRTLTHGFRAAGQAMVVPPATGWLAVVQSWPGAVKLVLAMFVVDFTIYWIHRAQHRFDAIWRTHAWHHTIENMYWFAGFRTSFFHSFIYNIPQAGIPMLLFHLSPLMTGMGYSVGLFVQFWEHTNLKLNIGPLHWLFITPQYHRVHHSATRYSRMNLGTTFSLWDRMFGTYVDPATMPDAFPLGLGEPLDKKEMPRMLVGV